MAEERSRKKICIAIHDLAHAGAERVAASWANYLAKQGHDVFVLVYACGKDLYDLQEGVRVVPVAQTRETFFQMSAVSQLKNMRKIVRSERPEIMISFLPKMQIYMMLATLGMRIRRIETVRNNPWIDKDVAGKRMLWNLCFRRSNAIVVQTEEQSLYFPESLRRKSIVIRNPISGDFLKEQKVYGNRSVEKFISVARINTQKNYPMMARAFAEATKDRPDCKLDIYGAGTAQATQELQALIDQLGMGERIQLCGWKRNVSELFADYDAFLMSSNYEGMPNALAEAMASGLVCLSTDCKTGPKDMIDSGENGFLAATGDTASFADGIQTILRMEPQQCAAMGNAARETIMQMCSEENTLKRLLDLIESV